MNAAKFRIGPLAVERGDVFWFSLALISMSTFVVGMALLGVTRVSGYFYLASLVSGAPVLLRMDYSSFQVPRAIVLYVLFLVAFSAVCLAHLVLGEVEPSIVEYVARMWIGIVNGFFFFALFRFDRRALHAFIALIAASHAAVAIAVAFFQGVDFSDLWFTGERVGGMTNPIPYSNMLFVSVGLVALYLVGRWPRGRVLREIGVVALICLAGLVGVLLTGTRGTLVAVPWLLLLIAWCYRDRVGRRAMLWGSAAAVGLVVVAGLVAAQFTSEDFLEVFDRTFSDRLRLRLWAMSWVLFADAPLFGHGLDSVPQVLLDLGLIASEKSKLFQFNHMHNQLLDLLVKTGLVGTVAFYGSMIAAIAAAVGMAARSGGQTYAMSIFWVAGAYFAYGLTSSYFAHANTILQFGVYLGMLIWLLPARGAEAAPR